MKILKNILIALIAIVIIGSVVIYFLPANYTVSNSIEINKPVQVVYAQVADYNKWAAWSPWKEKDPDAKITIEGAPGTVGHKMSWEGEKNGAGSMTLTSANPDYANPYRGTAADLAFIKPFKATAREYWKLEVIGDKTKVTWTDHGGLKYPFGRLFGLSVDKMLGDSQRHGLDNLKKVCEAIEMAPPVITTDSTGAVSK